MSQCKFLKDCDIEKIIRTKTDNLELYQESFIHKSAAKSLQRASYDRLEFVGDSVIGLIVSHYLHDKYPRSPEGELTMMKTKIVSSDGLYGIGKTLGLSDFIIMSKKGIRHGWNYNKKIVEDVFEALLGAFYIDKGYDACKIFLEMLINSNVDTGSLSVNTNYKDRVYQLANTRSLGNVAFSCSSLGNDHAKEFIVQLAINDFVLSEGRGATKKQGEQLAAHRALKCLCAI